MRMSTPPLSSYLTCKEDHIGISLPSAWRSTNCDPIYPFKIISDITTRHLFLLLTDLDLLCLVYTDLLGSTRLITLLLIPRTLFTNPDIFDDAVE